ncbi:sporulation initiation factor Spo0A C-terminal domain-containing protein [Desulfosporosinus youngiae]|uniref:sporulation initiation factor Spo0A C-terminal domain-containing protein n=1 Tax=Desulfosporosinus youngiae TaxID=339862 RepID=UPI00031DA3E0|nr:sporulation initiation factor Spo0A C-terminal domain-containing protein [Desulfosporosinus youngiae]
MEKLDQFDLEVINTLRELGVPAHIRGYEYIKAAIKYLQEKPDAIYSLTTDLYPTVAKRNNTKATRVERGIRHARTFACADPSVLKKVFGTSRELTNGEFLATFIEVIRIRMAGVA